MIQEMLSYSPPHIFQPATYYYWDNAIEFAYSKRQLGMHDGGGLDYKGSFLGGLYDFTFPCWVVIVYSALLFIYLI